MWDFSKVTSVNINKYGQVQISEDELFAALYTNKVHNLQMVNLDNVRTIDQFNRARDTNGDKFSNLVPLKELNITVEEFDRINQDNWFMPPEYKTFDIVTWLFDQCKTPTESARVAEELELYVQFNMIAVLQYLKYLVDTMRANKILWGVGRGSSVASYCLYLMGIHKINSIVYELDIKEFLK